jgi:inner membrane protein
MDPVSQAALGAAWAQSAARLRDVGAATAVGAIAGMAADIDVLIRSHADPLLALEYHRHFTHALLFIPFGALVCAVLVWPLVRRRLGFAHCFLYCLLGFASHSLLDACTSYGTRLLWPVSDVRIAWNIVSVIDPLFTLPLIAFVALGAVRRQPKLALVGIAWCLVYLGLGFAQNQRATASARELAEARGHMPTRLVVKPSLANIVLWKTIYEHDGHLYVDAVRLVGDAFVYEGERLVKLDLERDFPWLTPGSQQFRDVERFDHFANGYLAVDPLQPGRIVDMRYSLVPNRGDGFWGIELDASAPADAHAAYVTMRARPAAEGRELLGMIFR